MSSISSSDISYSEFKPPRRYRPAMVQTIMASLKFRNRGPNPVTDVQENHILDCGDGVRLAGALSRHPDPRAMVIFLHGWEGSENSTYVKCCARFLYQRNCSVFRLNFRDHGDTHHLNEEPFHSARFDEVLNGVVAAAKMAEDLPVYLVGFSLGGNFALRIVRHIGADDKSWLQHVFAISPVIHPRKASPLVDENILIRRYFFKKLRTSLQKKVTAFPDLYNFDQVFKEKTVMGMSELFLKDHSGFETSDAYFDSYRIWPNDLANVTTSTTLIMSEDDPVIPAEDIEDLSLSPCVRRIMLKYGGHNGFFNSLTGPTWYDTYIHDVISSDLEA